MECSTKKYIFLDVDGVLNSQTTQDSFYGSTGVEDALLERLAEIVRMTGAEVILSSTWREGSPEYIRSLTPAEKASVTTEDKIRYRYLEQKLTDIGVRIASIIGSNTRNTRAEEIEDYLEQHPEITSFCVIDDDKPSNRLKEHWIKTATGAGLDESNVEAAVAMLSFCK